jgi:tRNA-specific 2-thiouridylase
MGFSHFIVDIREEFGDYVIDNFVDEYIAGRTPNPCILCNTHIKWEAMLKRSESLDCEFIATGHYAIVNELDGRRFISKAVDRNKDQSYVLWGLSQKAMQSTLFPLGPYTKPEVRQMAKDFGYDDLSKKGESYEICFVPDNDYRGFLKYKRPGLEQEVAGGKFVDVAGNVIGEHEGYPFYTIGQRKGLKIAMGRPVYVTAIHPETNTVVLGDVEDLVRNSMLVRKVNWLKYAQLPAEFEVVTKVRYRDEGTLSVLHGTDALVEVEFLANVKGIAPGQSAVFYEGDDVVGGGIIQSGHSLS